ncbi:MAG: hypothetical protein QG567_761 [Campylobacterota bacterium]|nr:hypothetical protein [Campylobacterota bacterium]MDQ1339609.1 hypothetical protein [Campylobacterota bacterium]
MSKKSHFQIYKKGRLSFSNGYKKTDLSILFLVRFGFFGLGMIGIGAASIISELSALSKSEKENK